jgi:hypothetical protein
VFVPFYSTLLLAFESGNVIGLRMMKMMSGGSGSEDEAHLMVMEKIHAMFEASASLMAGSTASSVVDRYRDCEPSARYPLTVTDGKVSGAADVSGSIGREGIVKVSIRGAYANGRLNGNGGSGKWNGASGGIACSGRWEASRQ